MHQNAPKIEYTRTPAAGVKKTRMEPEDIPVISKSTAGYNVCFISWNVLARSPQILSHRRFARLFINALTLIQSRCDRGCYHETDGSKTPPVKIALHLRKGLRTMSAEHVEASGVANSGLLFTYNDSDEVLAVAELVLNRLNRIAVKTDRMGYGHDLMGVWCVYTGVVSKAYHYKGTDACVPAVVTADNSIVPFFEKLGFIKLSTVAPADMPGDAVEDTPMIHPDTVAGLTKTNQGYKDFMNSHIPAWHRYWVMICLVYMEHLDVEMF